jgi:hypothetical protein
MTLNDFGDLLGRLENSRAKNRRGNKRKRRNPPDVKKPIDRKTFEGIDDSTFNRPGMPGLVPGSMRRGPNVRYDRIGDMRIPEFAFRPTQPGGGPDDFGRPGGGMRGGMRTMEFRDRNGNRIDDRDEPGGSHYNEEAYKRMLQRQEERKTKETAKKEPARGSKYDAKPSAGTGKGKDFERMLRARMSKY